MSFFSNHQIIISIVVIVLVLIGLVTKKGRYMIVAVTVSLFSWLMALLAAKSKENEKMKTTRDQAEQDYREAAENSGDIQQAKLAEHEKNADKGDFTGFNAHRD